MGKPLIQGLYQTMSGPIRIRCRFVRNDRAGASPQAAPPRLRLGGLKPAHNVGNGATRWGVTGLALRAACAAADGERPEGGHGNGEGGPEPINGTQIESCQHKRAKRYQAEHKVAHLAQSSGKQFSIYLLDAPFGK